MLARDFNGGTEMLQRICCRINSIWGVMWSVWIMLVLTLIVVFLPNDFIHISINSGTLLLYGVLFLAIVSVLYEKKMSAFDSYFNSPHARIIAAASLMLFFIQGYIFYNMYFLTDWDAETVSVAAMYIASDGEIGWMPEWYYNRYSNNLLITWLLSVLYKLNFRIGNAQECTYFVILFQCALSCLSGYLLFKIVFDLTKPAYAYFAWLVFALHVALNPWISIPYTDAMALFIPLTIVRLYQLIQNGKYVHAKWFAIGFVAVTGYYLKPQCVIVFISIVICDGLDLINSYSKSTVCAFIKHSLFVIAASVLALALCNNVLFPSLGIQRNPDSSVGFTHYLMMGLNTETCGAYNDNDVVFSESFPDPEERAKANIQVAQDRLKAMGVIGLLTHLAKKTLVNFGDGTYAWEKEGIFYKTEFDDRNDLISPFLKNLYYSRGKYYKFFATFEHFAWITVLFASAGIPLYLHSSYKQSKIIHVLVLSLIGITLFQTIFEARARYFFIYSPLFIIAAILGWIGIVRTVCRIRRWIKERLNK